MDNPSILFVIDGIEFGGGERTFLQLIEQLPREKYNIYTATTPNGAFSEMLTKKNIDYVPLDLTKRFSWKALKTLLRIIAENNIDIVHSQGGKVDFYTRLASRILKSKIKVVNTIAMPVEGYDVSFLKKAIYCFIDRFCERYVDRFIVVSKSLQTTLENNHKIPGEKIALVYNGIELDEYQDEASEEFSFKLKKEFNMGKSVSLVGAIGRIVWQKGFEYLVEAVPAILKECPEVRFMIIGDGPLKKELVEKSRKLGIADKIIFTGFRTDIKEALVSIDILVMPSLREGFPMVTLEAMAMAKPIIAADIDGIREQIEHQKNGLLVPPENPVVLAEAVISLLKNKEKAERLGMAAKKRVEEEFSLKKMVNETESVYEDLPI